MITEREDDSNADQWDEETRREYELYCADKYKGDESFDDWLAAEEALPPHKRQGYAEMMYDYADNLRKAKRENTLK